MHDPWEGLTADGMINTGARRDRVPAGFEPVVDAVAEAVREVMVGGEIHLYGSVATGRARPSSSDVDVVVIGISPGQATAIGRELSGRFADVCRGVEIGAAGAEDFRGDDDERYGNRVFLRHYCVPLFGPDAVRSSTPFRGDARAARGFNGDIGLRLDRWRQDLTATPPSLLGRTVARKTLVAVAGLVSIHDQTWTTDRVGGARRWSEIHPQCRAPLHQLTAWASGDRLASATDLAETLAPRGIISTVVEQFAAQVGLWSERGRR